MNLPEIFKNHHHPHPELFISIPAEIPLKQYQEMERMAYEKNLTLFHVTDRYLEFFADSIAERFMHNHEEIIVQGLDQDGDHRGFAVSRKSFLPSIEDAMTHEFDKPELNTITLTQSRYKAMKEVAGYFGLPTDQTIHLSLAFVHDLVRSFRDGRVDILIPDGRLGNVMVERNVDIVR